MRQTTLVFLTFVVSSLSLLASADLPPKIIDAHVHLSFDSRSDQIPFVANAAIPNTRKQFEKEAKEAGLTAFVAHTSSEHAPTPHIPGLVPTFCVGVHDKINLPLITAGLKLKKYKCIKIYLGYTYRYAYDPIYTPLYNLAATLDVPVVFHTGDTARADGKVKYSHPLTIDEVAVDHPHTTFVIAHIGNPWIHDAAEVAYKNANVFLDASGIMIGDLNNYPETDLLTYLIQPIAWTFGYIENAQKMMFGTDWPLVHIKPYLDATLRAIPAQAQAAFLHDNAARIFHISD